MPITTAEAMWADANFLVIHTSTYKLYEILVIMLMSLA